MYACRSDTIIIEYTNHFIERILAVLPVRVMGRDKKKLEDGRQVFRGVCIRKFLKVIIATVSFVRSIG